MKRIGYLFNKMLDKEFIKNTTNKKASQETLAIATNKGWVVQ